MLSIATTRLIPLHTGKGRTVGQAISDIIDYVENPEKTNNGRLISSFQCDSRIADAEFLFSKQRYFAKTGRRSGADDVIAYQIRQSFVPGEITPEEANRLGYELARRFTKGNHVELGGQRIDDKLLLPPVPFGVGEVCIVNLPCQLCLLRAVVMHTVLQPAELESAWHLWVVKRRGWASYQKPGKDCHPAA